MHSVLAASSSRYRRWWYQHFLTPFDLEVRIAHDAIQCVTHLRRKLPDVLVLETPLLWGGADGVLEVLTSEIAPRELRVLLVTVASDAGEMYRVGQYIVDDVLSRPHLESRLMDHLQRLLPCSDYRAVGVSD